MAGFLVLHLAVQASALGGWGVHRRLSAALDEVPFALGFEIVGVYVPLLVHAALGVFLAARPELRPATSGPARALQRASAVVVAAFLGLHLWQFRYRLWTGEMDRADMYAELCASLSSTGWGGIPFIAGAYLVGVAAAAFHAAAGLYHAALEFRWVAAPRQRRWAHCCAALGGGLFVLGVLIVVDLATGSVVIRLPP